ncbi:MAG: type VI secretion system protein TssA [Pedosphaera sp.]|nr:type VI secretion system protein TssA [Pedosphaera sp.]
MSDLIEKLSQPVSAEKPCGPDLSNDPQFDELENLLKGKPEVDIGSVKKPAEPPDWGSLQKKSADFLAKSKHLRVAVMLTCCQLKTAGYAGFADGLQLIRGLLEKYWGDLYPTLDPEDNNDPTQRLNALRYTITADRGSLSGWLKVVDYLYITPICQPKGAPPLNFDHITNAKRKESGAEGLPPDTLDLTKVREMINATGADKINAQIASLRGALETTQAIDQFLGSTLGAGNSISFETLEKTLKELIVGLEGFVGGGAAEGAAGATGESGGGGIPISGSIRSREDVVRALDSICEFYRQAEPSSPVPYVLRRAQKLAMMNFVQAMAELNLANVDALKPSMGSAVESAAPPS